MIFMIFFATGIIAFAENGKAVSVQNITISGESMSIVDYKDIYGRQIEDRKSKQEVNTYQNAVIKINEISISEENIIFDYEIGNYQETLIGNLYNSSRNMDNLVAVFKNEKDFEILYFEITQGTELINLLYNTDLNGKPHIKIYMKDKDDIMYLFETELPEQFKDIMIDNEDTCDIYNDYLWYINFAETYITIVDTSFETMSIADDADPNAAIKRNIAIASNTLEEYELPVATTTLSRYEGQLRNVN